MNKTKISWTDLTVNPIIGCHKISPGCENCYAERMANRISHMDSWIGEQYREVVDSDGKWSGNTRLVDTWFDGLNSYIRPRKIFIGSMTDLFLHSQSNQGRDDIERLFGVLAFHNHHIFQILTKRPAAMKIFSDHMETNGQLKWPLSNVWLGVTVCNQEEANFKIPILLSTPAAIRFVSIEPILTAIKLPTVTKNINQIIIGGETGPGAREMNPNWVIDLWEQTRDWNISFFFKSWGTHKNTTCLDRPLFFDDIKQFPV